jgi:hypothetical protein
LSCAGDATVARTPIARRIEYCRAGDRSELLRRPVERNGHVRPCHGEMARCNHPAAAVPARPREHDDAPTARVAAQQVARGDREVPSRVLHHLLERDAEFLGCHPIDLAHLRDRQPTALSQARLHGNATPLARAYVHPTPTSQGSTRPHSTRVGEQVGDFLADR